MQDDRLTTVLRISFCLLIAAAGGVAADFGGLPLPYMLGAIGATMAAAMWGLPITRPTRGLVAPMRIVLGVLLGSTVTPALFANVGALAGTMVFVPVFIALVSALGMVYYRRVAGFTREEAFFSALPGGLYVMTTYAEEAGVDIRRIALAHALRITAVVLVVPFIVGFFADMGTVTGAQAAGSITALPVREMLLLTAAGAVGWFAAALLRFPGAQLVGPMVASAVIHATGLSAAKPPQELIVAAQLVLGAYIGARYVGERLATVRDAVVHAMGHVSLMLAVSALIALVLNWQFDLPVITGFLSFAPGGMSEIGLIALALGLDVGFIATIHVTRALTIASVAPLVYNRVKRLLHR